MDFVRWILLGAIISAGLCVLFYFWTEHFSNPESEVSCLRVLLFGLIAVVLEFFLPLFLAKFFGGKGIEILLTYVGVFGLQAFLLDISSGGVDYQNEINRYE